MSLDIDLVILILLIYTLDIFCISAFEVLNYCFLVALGILVINFP